MYKKFISNYKINSLQRQIDLLIVSINTFSNELKKVENYFNLIKILSLDSNKMCLLQVRNIGVNQKTSVNNNRTVLKLVHNVYEINQLSINFNYNIKSFEQLPNVQFYLGLIDSQSSGATGKHHDILSWDYVTKENEHGFIQWLFPNLPLKVKYCGDKSANTIYNGGLEADQVLHSIENASERKDQGDGTNSLAYAFNEEEIKIFRNCPIIKQNLIQSFISMLAFWGFVLSYGVNGAPCIMKANDYPARINNVKSNPHNYLRITRVILCLKLVGLYDYLFAFFRALIKSYEEGYITSHSMKYYCNSVKNIDDLPNDVKLFIETSSI